MGNEPKKPDIGGKLGELLSSETPGHAVEAVSGIAGDLSQLKQTVDGSIDKMGISEIDDIFKKFDDGPLAFIAALPMLFEQLGKIFDGISGVDLGSLSLTAPGSPDTPRNFEELKKLRSEEVAFKPERGKPAIAEMKEKSPNLYAMINYASRAIGVPFALIAATIQHESIWGTALSGDSDTSRGFGHFKKSTYEFATSQEYYREAMKLGPGEEPPERATNALSDICAIASLFRCFAENYKGPDGKPVDLTNLSKRDAVFFRAFYHLPSGAARRTKMFVMDDYNPSAKKDEDNDSWLVNRYSNFADNVLKYDKQYAQVA